MPTRYDTVSLLTDYGQVDEFVGVMKSVIRDLAPHVVTIDLTHEIPPHDVRAGGLALARCVQYVAAGVVLAVVDPGVGTTRKAVAVEVAGGEGVFVGPDNGLLAPAVQMAGGATRAVVLTNTAHHLASPAATFDGRDVFAPVAAALCNGVALDELGDLIDPVSLVPGLIPITRTEDDELFGEVLWVDRFGNVQLNVDPDELDPSSPRFQLRWGGQVRSARRVGTYAEVAAGEVGLVVDSYGLVSVAFDRRSAAAELGLAPGDQVVLVPLGEEAPRGPVSTPVTFRR
jgi:S-adenosylmethionine hydrolase